MEFSRNYNKLSIPESEITSDDGMSTTDSLSAGPKIYSSTSYGKTMNPPLPGMSFDEAWVVEMCTPVRDVCIFARDIPCVEPPMWIFEKREFSVFVTQVHTPFKFWFNLHLSENSEQLREFFADMHDFYNREISGDFDIRANKVSVGRACVALYANVWHRGEIQTALDTEDMCQVYFIDYGTTSQVHVSELRYLKQCFANCPRQALRGRLALVEPPRNQCLWKMLAYQDATYELAQICADRVLKAILYAYEDDENIFHLILVDAAQQPKPMNINRELQVRGFARYLAPSCEIFPHHDEIFPTFSALESGHFPCYSSLAGGCQMQIYSEYLRGHPDATKVKKTRKVFGFTKGNEMIEKIEGEKEKKPPAIPNLVQNVPVEPMLEDSFTRRSDDKANSSMSSSFWDIKLSENPVRKMWREAMARGNTSERSFDSKHVRPIDIELGLDQLTLNDNRKNERFGTAGGSGTSGRCFRML